MSLFITKPRLIRRFISSAICTILFAGSWCLSQTHENLFWLCISRSTYFKHIAIWLLCGLLIYYILYMIGKRGELIEERAILFFILISTINILDYGMRSVFGAVSKWPFNVLLCWSAITLVFPFVVFFIVSRIEITKGILGKLLQTSIFPCILLIWYAIPSDFAVLKIEKPFKSGERPPIHLVIFDMMSYDFMFKDNEINPKYPNFKMFSEGAEVYLDAHSPSDGTFWTIPQLLCGREYQEIKPDYYKWAVLTDHFEKLVPIGEQPTVFSLADKGGYNVFLQAFAFPYLNNFKKYVQYGTIYPFDTLWRAGMHSLIWPILSPGGIQHQKTANAIAQSYQRRIMDSPQNTFFYTHWNIPHDPSIYDSEGRNLDRFDLTKQMVLQQERQKQYIHQLTGTDRIFGKIIESIKASGTFNQSLIIVASDHNIKGFGFDMTHIPLLIKKPYQQKQKLISSKTEAVEIYSILKEYIYFRKSQI